MNLTTTAKSFIELAGWHSKSKIIVFVSDDWGTIRNFSKDTRLNLIKHGFDMEANRFDKYDMLESNTDLERLFDLLLSVKNVNDEHPVITAALNVANPDFDKIRASGFQNYFYESIDQTYSRSETTNKVLELYNQGIKEKIFHPEFHGREHLNAGEWVRALKLGREREMLGFQNFYWFMKSSDNDRKSYGAAFDLNSGEDILSQQQILHDGVGVFKRLFGYSPLYFTPPEGIYNSKLEKEISSTEIKLIDVPLLQRMPLGNNKYRYKVHYSGQHSSRGIRYIVRNVVFEPNLYGKDSAVDVCLAGVDKCFRRNIPVIISNHRAAFVGGIQHSNHNDGLFALKKLLDTIVDKWPDVYFLSMSDLYNSFTTKEI